MGGGGPMTDHATRTTDADQSSGRSADSEPQGPAVATGGAGNQRTQRLARGSPGGVHGGPREQPSESPLVNWVRTAAGVFIAPRPPGAPAPGDRYGSLDDPDFNAQAIADALNRAIDSSKHTLVAKSNVLGWLTEDVSRERRKVDASAVIAGLDKRTPQQINEIRVRYAAFEHRPVDALDTDLLKEGESERKADLTADQVKRITVLLEGTAAEPSRWFFEDDAKRNRLRADTIELHELLSDDLDEPRRERVMQLLRRPAADNEVIDSVYAKEYGESMLGADVRLRLKGAQLERLELLHDGEIAKADAVAIEDKRRQIEELNKQDAEVESRSTAETGFRLLAGVSTLDALTAEKRRKQREELTGEIEAILEQNKQEALADQSNLGKQSGEVIAARLTTILNQGDAEGHTLRGLLTATLSPRSAEAITAAVDPRNSGGDLLVETAAAQLREMVRNDKATGSAIESMLQSLRQSAVHDIRAKAHDPKVPLEEQQAITKDIPAAVEQLAQHYADGLVAAYDRMTGPFEPKFAQVVSGLKDADATHLEFARIHAGALAAGRDARLLDLADLQHAMDTKDVDGVKAVLRRQRNGNAVQKLVTDYDNIGIGRNLTRELFGKFFDDTDVTPEAAAELENTRFTNGMVAGRDAAQIAELLARPVRDPWGDADAAEVAWMASGASGEYDVTMEHRGLLRRIGERTGDPETKKLMAATRDRVGELRTQWERTTDPQERQHLFSEIRKARAALTGDADAYEKETEQIVAEFRSAVSFAVSIALAVALPGVGAGLGFLEATALNIGANIAANIVIKGDTYSMSDLEGDLLGGLAGAAGGKLGELGGELLGKVAQKIAGPVAMETGIVAERVGIRTELTEAAEVMISQGERIVIDTAEVQAKLAGTAAKAADSTLVSVAKETGNILGATAAAKAVSGDFSLSGADVVQTVAGIFGGKLAARRVAAKAARSMVRGGESAPASKGAEPHAQELAPPAAAPEVETSTAGPVEPPSVAEPQVTSPTLSRESGTPPTPTKDAAPPAPSADRPPAAAAESRTPAPSDEAEPGITRTTDPNAAAASMTPREVPEAEVRRVRGSTPVNQEAAAQVQQIVEGRMKELLEEFAAADDGRTAAAARGNLPQFENDFRSLMAEVGNAQALTPDQRSRALAILNQARGKGGPTRSYYEAFRDYAWQRLNQDPNIRRIAATPGSGIHVGTDQGAIHVDVVVTNSQGQQSSGTVSFDFEHMTRVSDQPFRQHSDPSGGNANLMPMLGEANRYYQEALRNVAGAHEFDAFGSGGARNDDIERFILQHQLGSAHSSFRQNMAAGPESATSADIELGPSGPGQGGNPPGPPGTPGSPGSPAAPESAPEFELGPAGSTARPFRPDIEIRGSSFVTDLITRANEGEAQVGDIARHQHQGTRGPTRESEHVTPANELSHRSVDPLIGAPDIQGRVGGNDTPDVANEYTIVEHEAVSDRKTSMDDAARRAMHASGGPTDFVEDLLLDPLARHQQASLDTITAGEISPLEATDPIHRALVAQAQVWERGQASGGMALARSRAAATGQPIQNLRNPARMRAAEVARRQARLAIEPGGIAGPDDYDWDATFGGTER